MQSYRHYWGKRNGLNDLNLQWDEVHIDSFMAITASEVRVEGNDPIWQESGGHAGLVRFIGSATYTVHNVATHEGGVTVRLEIDWPEPLPTCVDYTILD
jgi:hypothetical protein